MFHWLRPSRLLGYVVGAQRLQSELSKIEAVQNATISTTKKQVRSFWGLVGFNRKYIPNFSAIVSPLSVLTKKGQVNKVKWTDTQQHAFDTFKKGTQFETNFKVTKLSRDVHSSMLQTMV